METVKCPGCNSSLIYNLDNEILKCNYCGSVCTVQEAQMTDREFLDERLMDVHEAKCPDCGARLITGINTISSKCVYCGGSIIYDEKVNKVFKPKKLLLFEITLKDAKEKLNEYLKINKIKNRSNIIKNLKPVYLPYWLYNSKVVLEYEQDGKKYVAKSEYKNILADASTNISDILTDRFDEDFEFSKLKDFELALIAGHCAEEFDVVAKQVYRRVLRKIENKAREVFPKNVRISSTIDDKMYVLLPFYYVEFYENSILNGYQVLINGQNGNINMEKNRMVTYANEKPIKLPTEFYIRRFLAIASLGHLFILGCLILFFLYIVEVEKNLGIFDIIGAILFLCFPISINILVNDGYLLKIDENKKKYFMWKYNRRKHY